MSFVFHQSWRAVVHLVFAFALRFGLPGALARGGRLPRGLARAMRRALGALEQSLRALILKEAALLPETKARRRRSALSRARDHGRGGFASDNSEDWGVSFRLAPSSLSTRSSRATARRRPARAIYDASPWPLAERFEAALRVLENPAPFIRRAAAWSQRRSPDAPQARSGVQGTVGRGVGPWAPGLTPAFAGGSPGERVFRRKLE